MTKILLNKVFVGEYLDKNIGHEAVCLFKADNGEHYIYVTPYGEVSKTNELKENDYILLVRSGIQKKFLEVIGYATGLECICSKEFLKCKSNNKNDKIEAQKEWIKNVNIRYGGALLTEILESKNTKKSDGTEYKKTAFYTSFRAKKVKLAKEKIYITRDKEEKEKDGEYENICYIPYTFTRNTQYLYDGLLLGKNKDKVKLEKLIKVIENDKFWDDNIKKIYLKAEDFECLVKNENLSFMKIIGKQNDELAFSNWISYWLDEDRELLAKFCQNFTNTEIDKENTRIFREYENIDIYIKDDKNAIVIENKIKSGINSIKQDEETNELTSQLDKYYGVAKEKDNEGKEREVKCILLLPNHHNIVKEYATEISEKIYKTSKDIEYKILTYADIYGFFKKYFENNKSKTDFEEAMRKEFLKALEPHTKPYQNELYETAMYRLVKKIINLNKQH